MNLPTIFDWLARLEFVRGLPAVYLVLVTAVLIVVTWDWRLALSALAGQYLVAGLLFADILDPRLAMVKVLVGLFVCIILTITAGQVNWGHLPVDVTSAETRQLEPVRRVQLGPFRVPADVPLRLFLAAVMLLVVLVVAGRPSYHLLAVDQSLDYLNLAVYALVAMGLLGLSLTTDPFQAGIGALMFLTGFELFYGVLAQSGTILAALATVNLVVTVAIAYLTQARYAFTAMVE
jgi:hypothetical protein